MIDSLLLRDAARTLVAYLVLIIWKSQVCV